MSEDDVESPSMLEIIEGCRVFVLGAGFSASAGVPLTGPLLGQAMDLFRGDGIGLFERVEDYVRACFGISGSPPDYFRLNLPELCTYLEYMELREYGGGERWSDAGSQEKLALQFYLAKAIVSATPTAEDVPELYRAFARELKKGDIVISFNWDTLLENALEAEGKGYTYSLEADAIWLAKLHGSVNWRWGEPRENTLEWTPLNLNSGALDVDIYSSDPLLKKDPWQNAQCLGEIQPMLVLPGFGKAFDVRRLAGLWYKPEWAFAFTHDVYVLGLALGRDDFIVRSFLLANLPYIEGYSGVSGRRVVIVNPDPLVRDNFGFLVGQANVSYLCEDLEEKHIEMIVRSGRGRPGRGEAV